MFCRWCPHNYGGARNNKRTRWWRSRHLRFRTFVDDGRRTIWDAGVQLHYTYEAERRARTHASDGLEQADN